MLSRKEVRVGVSVGGAKKRRCIGQDKALPIVGINPSFLKWDSPITLQLTMAKGGTPRVCQKWGKSC